MRNGLFFGAALVASMLFGGTAFADRADDGSTNSNNKPSRGQNIKEQVLEKMKEGSSRNASRAQGSRRENSVTERIRPKGDLYTDQGTRGSKTKSSTSSGRNMSASNKVNTPREIKAMLQMINPMFGAYRTAAGDGTDSYGGSTVASPGYMSSRKGTNTVHFKNDKGEVIGKATGDTGAAKRVKETREKMNDAIKAKMSKK